MNILITSPETDIFTRYIRVWAKRLIKELRSKNHNIFHLDKGKANRKKTAGLLAKKDIQLVLFNGHGNDCELRGQNEVILDAQNIDILSGKIVHAMSCSTAKELGSIAVKSGAKAYVGYDAPFLAPTFNEKNNNPLEDDTAALFLNPAFSAQRALANGKTPNEAITLAKNEYNRSIVKALKSDIQSDNDQFVGLLLYDRNHLVACE